MTLWITTDNDTKGDFLGRGAAGDVHEVIVRCHKLAHKRMVVKRKLGGKEMKEIDILKRLSSHEHIIQLVGTYTHRQFLGLLMYPVAVCDMATFFDDVEAWHKTGLGLKIFRDQTSLLEPNQKRRLEALGYDFPLLTDAYRASPVYSKIGCLVSATAFLHDQKIRHKDFKPSNILLAKDRMWLSDFGSATDFSLLSQSATDNERGTPRYFSPEVSSRQCPNIRRDRSLLTYIIGRCVATQWASRGHIFFGLRAPRGLNTSRSGHFTTHARSPFRRSIVPCEHEEYHNMASWPTSAAMVLPPSTSHRRDTGNVRP